MKKLFQCASVLLLFSVLNSRFANVSAQGTAFTYQGRLQNNGSPAGGSYDLQFSLFTTNVTGTALAGPVTNTAVGVTNGLFTTTVDFGPGVFTGASNWLQIAVSTNRANSFSTLAPRQQLTPVPYALTAATVSGVLPTTVLPGFNGSDNAVGGGSGNNMGNASAATIAGGQNNTVDGAYSAGTVNFQGVVGGGFGNTVAANYATIAGGENNTANAYWSTIGGGQNNYISNTATYATIGGGGANTNTGSNATIPGGFQNMAGGPNSFAAGSQAQATNNGAFVWSDNEGSGFGSTTTNQFNVRANGGVVFVTKGAGMTLDGQNVLTGTSSLNAANLTGAIPVASLPARVVTNTETGVTLSGSFSGNGGGLTNLNAAQLAGGAIPLGQLPVVVVTNNASGVVLSNLSVSGASAIAPLTVVPLVPTAAIGSKSLSANPTTAVVAGRYAYALVGYGLQIFDVSNPANPVGLGSVATGNYPTSIAVAGRYAYVACYDSDVLQVFDVSDPSGPFLAGSVGTGNNPQTVAVAGRYAYVVNLGSESLEVFDLGNPTSPVLVGSVGTDNEPFCVVVAGRYAYVVNYGGDTLEVFDVGNPASPAFVGRVGTGTQPQALAVVGRYAYVVNESTPLLQVFDVGNPASPISAGSVGTGYEPQAVAVAGRYAYVVNFSSGTLQVFDVSTPASPVVVGSVGTGSGPTGLAVSGRYAYVLNSEGDTLQVFNLGGAYLQHLEAGAAEIGTLQTRDTVTVGNNLNVNGGLTASGSARITGGLSATGLLIGTNGTSVSVMQSGQAIMPSSNTVETNFSVTFPQAFTAIPKVIASLSGDTNFPSVGDTFVMSIRALTTTTGFTINVYRVDQPNGWSQQLRVNWQAWQ